MQSEEDLSEEEGGSMASMDIKLSLVQRESCEEQLRLKRDSFWVTVYSLFGV